MTGDLVERLRSHDYDHAYNLKTDEELYAERDEAADRIEALEAKLAEKDALIEHAGGDGVTEGDRDAAKSLLGRDDAGPSWWSIDSGNADNDRLVQAFTRHRAAAFAAGKAARGREIVEWLREDHGDWSTAARKFADAIERGEVWYE